MCSTDSYLVCFNSMSHYTLSSNIMKMSLFPRSACFSLFVPVILTLIRPRQLHEMLFESSHILSFFLTHTHFKSTYIIKPSVEDSRHAHADKQNLDEVP